MRVLLAYARGSIGGIQLWMASVARELTARGHEAELFFFEGGEVAAQPPDNVTVTLGSLADLVQRVAYRACDIVHVAAADYDLGLRAVRGLTCSTRLVVTDHGCIHPGWHSDSADAVVGISRWVVESQESYTDLPVHLIYNGIDVDRFRPNGPATGGPPIVAWVGRTSDAVRKGVPAWAALAPELKARGFRVWMADPDGPGAVAEAPRAALAAAVERWTTVAPYDMPEFYRTVAASGGCVVSTSASEGLVLSLVEAQACGCPVAGPSVRGVSEAICPDHGALLYPADQPASATADQLAALLADPEDLARRGDLAQAYARRRFTLSRMVDEYLAVYENLPDAPVRPRPRRSADGHLAALCRTPEYVEERWSCGRRLHEAACELADRGELALARRLDTLAWGEAPTLFARPQRLAKLVGRLVGR